MQKNDFIHAALRKFYNRLWGIIFLSSSICDFDECNSVLTGYLMSTCIYTQNNNLFIKFISFNWLKVSKSLNTDEGVSKMCSFWINVLTVTPLVQFSSHKKVHWPFVKLWNICQNSSQSHWWFLKLFPIHWFWKKNIARTYFHLLTNIWRRFGIE